MDELQAAMDEILTASPELTFREVCTELVQKGELDFEATENLSVHTYVYQIFQRSKIRSNTSIVL